MYNIIESNIFKLEGVPNLNDLHFSKSGKNHCSDKNQCFQIPSYYMPFDSEFNAYETLSEADLGLLQHPKWNVL